MLRPPSLSRLLAGALLLTSLASMAQPLPTAMPPETRQRNLVNSRRLTCSASTRSMGKSTSGAVFSGNGLFVFIRYLRRVRSRPWAS